MKPGPDWTAGFSRHLTAAEPSPADEIGRCRLKPAVRVGRSPAVRAVLLLLLAACGTSQPSTLYRTPCNTCGTQPSLADGEIRMTTHWTGAQDEIPDVRAIVCEQGRITCSIETATQVRREGCASEADWNKLWSRLGPVTPWAPFPPTVKPNDPSGGPYHVIQLRAGTQVSQFSSQYRTDLVVFTSREASDRLQYSNFIVDFVSARARTPVAIAPAPPPPAEVPAEAPKKP